jgi:intracellular sulfur oxidation DsrE/DsrF family protein
MRLLKALLIALALTFAAAVPAAAADAVVKTVYHLNDGRPQAQRALNNIRNHLDVDPTARIVVVTHGAGIDFLIEGAEAADGTAFSGPVDELAQRGVKFVVCNNTLVQRHIAKEKILKRAVIVPSGVAEVARLQTQEGFGYLRP